MTDLTKAFENADLAVEALFEALEEVLNHLPYDHPYFGVYESLLETESKKHVSDVSSNLSLLKSKLLGVGHV